MQNNQELLPLGTNAHVQEIISIIQGKMAPPTMREKLRAFHENDLAQSLEYMTLTQRQKLYRMLPPTVLSEVFSFLDEPAPHMAELDIRQAVELVALMEPDDAVEVLHALPKERRDVILDLLDPKSRKDIALIASFSEDEIGSCMTTDYIEVPYDCSAKDAMAAVAQQAKEVDNIATLYLLDANRTFCGAVSLRDLIIAPKEESLTDLCQTSFPYVYADEEIADCIEQLKDYSEDSIPVLDHQNRILGIVTAQDILQVAEEEMNEDYARLAGLTAQNDLKESVVDSSKKRLPWLLALLGLGLVVSSVVGIFEAVVAQLPLIICFQSLILDMSGNVGTQSLAVTIRVLTDETIPPQERLRLVPREMKVGLFNGIILGVLSLAVIGCYLMLAKGQTPFAAFSISACIGFALMVSMMISGISGTIIPIFFKKINVDPAVASGPLITTVNDLVAVVVYYGLSWLVLIPLFHLG